MTALFTQKKKKKPKNTARFFFFFFVKHHNLSYNFSMSCVTLLVRRGSIFGIAQRATDHCLKRDQWHLKSSAVSKQLPILVPLGPAPSAPVWPCHRQRPRLVRALFSRLCILALFFFFFCFPYLPAFSAIPRHSCIHSQGWGFPGLIKAKRVFQFRVIERVQHINMLGQHYQPLSLLGVIDDGPSTLAQQTS